MNKEHEFRNGNETGRCLEKKMRKQEGWKVKEEDE